MLLELLSGKQKWIWTEEHQKCFDDLKGSLEGSNALGCFSNSAVTKVIVDASPVGLGAMLVQMQKTGNNKVIAYASRSLNEVEQRYSQLVRESLAIYFGCIKFQMKLLGKSFTVHTNHKLLVSIFNNPKKNTPFRVDWSRLKLQSFEFHVKHISGKFNSSDYPSRRPMLMYPKDDTCVSDELQAYINQIIKTPDLSLTIEEIEKANSKDQVICKITQMLKKERVPSKRDNLPNNFLTI